MSKRQDDRARVERLCPALRRIVDAELRAGNRVHETWEEWGFVVVLSGPFRAEHELAGGELRYTEIDDPHYWKSQYDCATHAQTVACRFAASG